MSGILDYGRYIELFATVKDVIEHFPSEQYTLPYEFNNLGSQGYTATIHYQSFILDQFSYTTLTAGPITRRPNFDSSTIIGYFPAQTIAQPSTSTVQLPKDMYVYPMYPERLVNTPVTLVSYRFSKGTDQFTRQLLLIENWEPGITIGNPLDDPAYTPIDKTAYKFSVDLSLNTSTFSYPGTLNLSALATPIGALTTSTEYFDNTTTVRILNGATELYVTSTNFIDGSLTDSTVIGTEYFPTTIVGSTYTITGGSFTTSTFNYTATVVTPMSVRVSWQSLDLGDSIILGGTTSTLITITKTLNSSTELVPLTVSIKDISFNTATSTAFTNQTLRISAAADLQSNYAASSNQVEFWADYSPDYNIQNFILPRSDPEGDGAKGTFEIIMPRKNQPNQITLGRLISEDLVGETFQFPNSIDTSTYTVVSQDQIDGLTRITLDKNWSVNPYWSGFYNNSPVLAYFSEKYTLAAFTLNHIDYTWIYRTVPSRSYGASLYDAEYTNRIAGFVGTEPRKSLVRPQNMTVDQNLYIGPGEREENRIIYTHPFSTYTNLIAYQQGRDIIFSNNLHPNVLPNFYQGSYFTETFVPTWKGVETRQSNPARRYSLTAPPSILNEGGIVVLIDGVAITNDAWEVLDYGTIQLSDSVPYNLNQVVAFVGFGYSARPAYRLGSPTNIKYYIIDRVAASPTRIYTLSKPLLAKEYIEVLRNGYPLLKSEYTVSNDNLTVTISNSVPYVSTDFYTFVGYPADRIRVNALFNTYIRGGIDLNQPFDLLLERVNYPQPFAPLRQIDRLYDYGLTSTTTQTISGGDYFYIKNQTTNLQTGTTFIINTTSYTVVKQEIIDSSLGTRKIYLDPPWIEHDPNLFGNLYNSQVSFENPSVKNYRVSQITELEYSPGLNAPYYSGAYIFDRIKLNSTIPIGSEFQLYGGNQSPPTVYVLTTATDGWYSFSPNYTITATEVKPQWQIDNDIYRYFEQKELRRDIAFYYNPFFTNQATLIGCYGETTLIFDRIPYNLRVGATFRMTKTWRYQNYTILSIDAFRNILTVSKGSKAGALTSYDYIGLSTTFTNPPAPSTTSTFLGTATTLFQSGGNFTWYLDRTLDQGNYKISARINTNIITGTNVAYIYPKNSITSSTVDSTIGLDAGLYMTLDQSSPLTDRVVVTSNVATSRRSEHFYTFPTPVTWNINGSTLSTSSWVRQGTSFIQTATLTVNKGILNPTFYADWAGTLAYTRTYSDQILFTPDQLAFTPASTTTVSISSSELQHDTLLTAQAQVQIVGTPYPLQDDYIPDGTITFTAIPQTVNYATGQSTDVAPQRNLGSVIMSNGVASLSTQSLALVDTAGLPTYYRLRSSYSGDAFRSASTSTSTLITVVPNTYMGEYCNEITDNTNGSSFNNGTFLQLNRFPNPDPYRVVSGDQWVDVRIDSWLEPVTNNTWTASLTLADAVVKPWFIELIDDGGRTRDQFVIDALYSYNLPQPPNFPTSQYQVKVYHYTNQIVEQRGYQIKRSMRFVAKFRGGTPISRAVHWIELYTQIGTPGHFRRSVNLKDNCFRLRSKVQSVNWSNTDPW